jgi:hypothetical protein
LTRPAARRALNIAEPLISGGKVSAPIRMRRGFDAAFDVSDFGKFVFPCWTCSSLRAGACPFNRTAAEDGYLDSAELSPRVCG